MAKSAYIHIPFCQSKCKYCSFVSFVNEERKLGYIYSLLKDIDVNYGGECLKTLYFGGGTPSLIEPENLKKIINKFNLDEDCEITLEMNPDDANIEYLKALFDIGINRLSIGAQTFDDNVLKLIGRRHNSEQISKSVEIAKQAGFKNISLDLIYGLPNVDIKKDLDKILSLDINHISTYGLKIEQNSYFYNHKPENLPDEDSQADMYLLINAILSENGYKRYEISNFAKKGFESRHNLNYWNNLEYYGFGIAAHGYIDGVRYNNTNDFEKYLNKPYEHEKGHIVTTQEKLEEEIFLGFRREMGIDINDFYDKYNIDFEQKYRKIIEKYAPRYLVKEVNNYKLTNHGVLISNYILSEFLE